MAETRRAPAVTPYVVVATVLGLAHAAISLVWAFGGTWLLDTVGGQIEDWGREGGLGVRLALVAVVVAKVAAVALLWLAVRRGRRPERVLAWLAAAVLTLYGGVLTVVGLAATWGLLELAPKADERAIAWHAYLWDPWFLLWGVATVVALWLSRRRPDR